jgi:glycosyltransferase involved in cell wall biosynthesis
MNKKTILYLVTQAELGGAQRYILDLAKNLNNEFNIIVSSGEFFANSEFSKQLEQAGIKFSIIPHLKRSISPINDFLAIYEIIKLIKKIKPDVVHLNSSKISILGSLAIFLNKLNPKSKILNQKLFYTVHGWVFNEPLSHWQKLFYKYAEKITARWKDKIICVSEADRLMAIKEKIAPASKLITIHNGIALIDFLSKEEAKERLITNYELRPPEAGPLRAEITNYGIVSIGNFYKTKGFEYLIKAIHILVTRYTLNITCTIIGDGDERENLEKFIKELKLENNFWLLGKINDAAEILNAFDIYVCSSVKEGLPYSIIEAMQAGLPIVATDVGGNSELIKNQTDGILVPAKDPEKLAEEIYNLINNPNIRENLGKITREKALANFTLEKMIEETKKLYL